MVWGIKDEYFEKVYPHQTRKAKREKAQREREKPLQCEFPFARHIDTAGRSKRATCGTQDAGKGILNPMTNDQRNEGDSE